MSYAGFMLGIGVSKREMTVTAVALLSESLYFTRKTKEDLANFYRVSWRFLRSFHCWVINSSVPLTSSFFLD